MPPHAFNGPQYKLASKHQKEWGARIIADLDLRGDERILDLGCGDGVLTEQLAHRVPRGRVIGLDNSPSMIRTARQIARDNLTFTLMDINDLAFNETFDLIFSNATLNWVKDHGRLLPRVRQLLRSPAQVRFNFAAAGNCSTFNTVVQELMNQPEYRDYFRTFPWPWYFPVVCEYETLARTVGFAQLRVWGENADRHFADADEMTRWIDQPSLIPFLPVLPEPLRQPFRDAVVDAMVRRARQPDGTCFETFRRVNVWARA